jgi:hypothetical protein
VARQAVLYSVEVSKRRGNSAPRSAIRRVARGGRASDIDVMCLNGFNFPHYRGGLMYWADTIGVGEVYCQIAARHPYHWCLGRQFQIKRYFRHASIAVLACSNGSGTHLTGVDDRAVID